MAGYIHDPLQIINLIADNLRDRYESGFPVLKEIIQNVDDAGCGNEKLHLEFGLSPGLPEAEHQLLRGPALYFLNNGDFKDTDSRAIRSFGLNRKAAEQTAIGKFGLGMKSVFHFCEAFFFLAENREKKYEEILNPWSGDDEFSSFHSDWDNFSPADADKIREQLRAPLAQMLKARKSYFLLWLPLRKKEHLDVDGTKVGSIITEFPGDDDNLLNFLYEEDLAQRLASLLPLLRRVVSIRFRDTTFVPIFDIALDKRSKRIGLASDSGTAAEMAGVAQYRLHGSTVKKYSLFYAGQQAWPDPPELQKLRKSAMWPKTFIRNEQGKSVEAPDRAQGHGAAVFSSSSEKGNGRLDINWAVFLPVGEKNSFTVRCDGDTVFRLTLHGHFFIDAGRVFIEGLLDDEKSNMQAEPENEVDLRRKWNRALAHQGTLPLILPALKSFASRTRLSAENIWNLCEALGHSPLFKSYQKTICKNDSWVCRLTKEGRQWKKVASQRDMFVLPAPPQKDSSRPWQVFPRLDELTSDGAVLLLNFAPHLHLRITPQKVLPQWDESNLLKILDVDVQSVFSDQGKVEYLIKFLRDSSVFPILKYGRLQTRLRDIAARAFGLLRNKLQQNRSKVQDFIGLIQPNLRYQIKNVEGGIFWELQKCGIEPLLVSREFDDAEEPGKAELSFIDGLELLEKLHELIVGYEFSQDQKSCDNAREIASEILKNLKEEQRIVVLKRASDLKIVAGYDCSRGVIASFSPAELEGCRKAGLLFLYSQGTTPGERYALGSKLQAVLASRVVLVNRATADLVLGRDNGLQQCDANSVLKALGGLLHEFQENTPRQALISEMAAADLSTAERVKGLRYLLHGQEELFEYEGTLWISGYEQSAVWRKLWQQLEQGNELNVLSREIVGDLPSNKWGQLGIKEIRPQDILTELRQIGTSALAGEAFPVEEREMVLRELDGDEKLWMSLPFHETIHGQLVRVDAQFTYLESGISLPEELTQNVFIIKHSNTKDVARQQKDWLAPLTPSAAVQLILQYEQPAKFWSLIMTHLSEQVIDECFDLLCHREWLVSIHGWNFKPADVIKLESIQDEVDRLLAASRGAFTSEKNLHQDIQNHPAFASLSARTFSTGRKGLEKLSLLIADTENYHIGQINIRGTEIDQVAEICARLPQAFDLPGWKLLANAVSSFPSEDIEQLLPAIQQPIPQDKIHEILCWLQQEHATATAQGKEDTLLAFNGYLAALVDRAGATEIIAQLKLLNREGRWAPSHELCAEAEGVADSHLLEDTQKRILYEYISLADRQQAHQDDMVHQRRNLQPEINASAAKLEEYFSDWEGLVPPELICAFLSLLGDDTRILRLAEKYKGRHSVQWIRDNIPWKVNDQIERDGRQEWMYGFDQHQALWQHRYIINCSEGVTVTASSILGKSIEVPLKARLDSLISGGLYYELSSEPIIPVRITLQKPNMEDSSSNDLAGYLRATAEYLLEKAYNQKDFDLGPLWEKLGKSEQLDIRIAQQLVLSHIPFYLRQLGAHKHPQLKKLINDWNEARYKREEYYETGEKTRQYENVQRDVLATIQDLLKNDEEVQNAVLASVRAKIRDYQYTASSIPFELFQNADDAVVELALIKAYPDVPDDFTTNDLPRHVKRFLVVEEERSLSFVHWGRAINSIGGADFPGREKGFHHDLEKMLVLSSSDKSSENKVTGKFGLGFKSVLLACDTPKIVSGQLATEIIAGLCPTPMSDSGTLRSRLRELSTDRRWQGTLIELPLKEVTGQVVMESFYQLAGLMTIFSKQIRRIDVHGSDEHVLEWAPMVIELAQRGWLEFGDLPLFKDTTGETNALYLRLAGGGLLFALGPKGFRSLPDVPAIWVVGPTKEAGRLGFAINCDFALDAGRDRLTGNSHENIEKAERLGWELGKALYDIFFMIEEDWQGVKKKFRLESDLTVYDFWASLWETISSGLRLRGSEDMRSIISNLFCGSRGLGYLASQKPILPNGLWREYRMLIGPDQIRTVLTGCLAQETYFNCMIKWDFFRSIIGDPSSIISEAAFSFARRAIPALGETTKQWKSVCLADIARNFVTRNKQMDPEAASILGALFSADGMKHEDLEQERHDIEKAFNSMQFKSESGDHRPAHMLIAAVKHSQANPDERHRAAFAPADNILSKEYRDTALDFFFVCREKIGIEVELMAEWLVAAEDENKRAQGLRYILDGEYGERVAQILREGDGVGTWLAGLDFNSPYFRDFTENEISELILRKLPSLDELRDRDGAPNEEGKFRDELSQYLPGEALERIHDWWTKEREEYLGQYETQIYPRNLQLNLLEDEAGRIDRRSWLVLLSLAHFQTIGRQRDQQHRGFIEQCIEKGWWDTFALPAPEQRSDEWMDILEQYVHEQVDSSEYEIWMNRFPVIYKFARWLDEYYEAFMSINRMAEVSKLSTILNTKSSATYQGGGISAPPIEKSLSIGACFVIRELKRKQVLNGAQVKSYCYMPNGRLRELIEQLGCSGVQEGRSPECSKIIHGFLCEHLGEEQALFSGSYDIPLQIVAGNEEVRAAIFSDRR